MNIAILCETCQYMPILLLTYFTSFTGSSTTTPAPITLTDPSITTS